MDNTVEITVQLEDEKLKFDGRIVEEKDTTSVIVFFSLSYAHDIENYESKNKNIPNIYFGEKLVKKCTRLPFENSYDDDDDFGKICLFPKAKYEFFF
jgi:hypothetical protein